MPFGTMGSAPLTRPDVFAIIEGLFEIRWAASSLELNKDRALVDQYEIDGLCGWMP